MYLQVLNSVGLHDTRFESGQLDPVKSYEQVEIEIKTHKGSEKLRVGEKKMA